MKITTLLIANRGEIAVRIERAAAELGIRTVAVYSADDEQSMHLRLADQSYALKGTGPGAYLDGPQIIEAARQTRCDAVHPGYGFLSENAAFARSCLEEGLIFVGPTPELLDLFGNKAQARALAGRCGVPLLPGTQGATSLDEARAFFLSLGEGAAVMIKAVSGGGGRGMRQVNDLAGLEEAYARCRSEARAACGSEEVYIERLMVRPRHIEVQIVGDGERVIHLGERDCTMQRRNQKLMEVSPCPTISPGLRDRITGAALRMAREARYVGLGTFEFLVEDSGGAEDVFAFMEVNPRLQVEHTVTEEVTGVDLVKTQIEIASGRTLAECGLTEMPAAGILRLQVRINTETMDQTGSAGPASGTLSKYEVPSGPGVRVDGYGYSGYTTNPAFDSLLAKLIVTSRSPRYGDVVAKARRALAEFRIEGVQTNIAFLQHLLSLPEVVRNDLYTRYIEDNAASLVSAAGTSQFGVREARAQAPAGVESDQAAPEGALPVHSPIHGRVVAINAASGDAVAAGQTMAVIEAMKMEHVVSAEMSGYVRAVCVGLNDVVSKGSPLFYLDEAEVAGLAIGPDDEIDLDAIRPDLAEVMARHAFCLDENRPEAVAKRRKKNQRTARENVEDLCDPGSFIEYGALLLAAQRRKLPIDELIRKTPADGLVAGVGSVNGPLFGEEKARCMVMAYDFTVFAGTQGLMNHKKMDRMLSVAHEWGFPVALFAEGGGGRPSDTDANVVAALDISTFSRFAGLSGRPPCGNRLRAVLCRERGPAGLLRRDHRHKGFQHRHGRPCHDRRRRARHDQARGHGPIEVQTRNGVVDIAVADEAEAVAMAKKYLSYCQGTTTHWEAADQRLLRRLIPENRLRVYDMRSVIEKLADTGTVLELRRHFGPGMITALIRLEGRPMGVMANNPMHMGGAIEAEAADKAARFMQVCNAYDLPILSLCDTPGFMVGPEVETGPRSVTCAGCSWSGRTYTCRFSPWSCARATAWEPWPWRAGDSMTRSSQLPGPRANSGPWASRGRSSTPSGKSSGPWKIGGTGGCDQVSRGPGLRDGQGHRYGLLPRDRRGH